jgi:adenylate cyclase
MWDKLRQQIWRWRGIWAIAPTTTLVIFLVRATGILQGPELAALDTFFRLRPTEPIDERILVVGISEADLQEYGHPINDKLLAEALRRIAAGEPRAIGLDIYRDLPVPPPYPEIVEKFRQQPQLLQENPPLEPGYAELTQLYRDIENLIGIAKITGGAERVDPPPVLAELGRIAANDLPRDKDGRLRRAFLYLTDPQSQEVVLSIGLHLALLHLEPEGITPRVTQDERQWVQLSDTRFVPLSSGDGGYGTFDDRGYQIFINYRNNGQTFETIELRDILEGRVSSDIFFDRTVMIGHTAESLKDFFDTPLSIQAKGIEKTSGVEVHANVVSHILSSVLDGRSQILTLPNVLEWTWIFLAAISGAGLAWIWRYSDRAMRLLGQILSGTLIIGISYLAFLQGWWIPLLPPLLAQGIAALCVVAYVARSAIDIRHTFSRYLTDEVVATILETPEGLQLGGERRKITILTSDLRGFTSISERLPPEKVLSILNIYLEAMADAITAYQGTIDEFMGDGILVLFGAPTQREDDAERAIACAIAMQRAMTEVNQKMSQLDLPTLEMGIGINTGEVVVGNIGSLKRTKYGVVGSQVNLTYRIESYTVGGQILVTESTLDEVDNIVDFDGEEKVCPKGVIQPISIYSVVGISGKHNLSLSRDQLPLHDLHPALSVSLTPLQGKQLGDRHYQGHLIKLSPHAAHITSTYTAKPLTNIKFMIETPQPVGEGTDEFYGKVIKEDDLPSGCFAIRLTAVSMELKAYFEQLYDANCSQPSSVSQSLPPS